MNLSNLACLRGFSATLCGVFACLFLICFSREQAQSAIMISDSIVYGVQSEGSYDYTFIIANVGSMTDDSVNTIWYAWSPGQDNLPKIPTNITSASGWVFTVTHEGPGDGGWAP